MYSFIRECPLSFNMLANLFSDNTQIQKIHIKTHWSGDIIIGISDSQLCSCSLARSVVRGSTVVAQWMPRNYLGTVQVTLSVLKCRSLIRNFMFCIMILAEISNFLSDYGAKFFIAFSKMASVSDPWELSSEVKTVPLVPGSRPETRSQHSSVEWNQAEISKFSAQNSSQQCVGGHDWSVWMVPWGQISL